MFRIYDIDGSIVFSVPKIGGDSEASTLEGQSIPYQTVSGNIQMKPNNGYLVDNAVSVDLLLPSNFVVGDVNEIIGVGPGGFRITQNFGQTIRVGETITESGQDYAIVPTIPHAAIKIVASEEDKNMNALSHIGTMDSININPAFDADVQTWITAVESAGGTLTATEKNAVNAYVVDAKGNANAWWTDTLADYPMVGGNANGFAINLKTPGTFDLTWVNTSAGDFTSTGITFNGSSYARTGFVPSAEWTIDSSAMEFYSRTTGRVAAWDMGCFQAGPDRRTLLRIYDTIGDRTLFYFYTGADIINTNPSTPNGGGSFMMSRISNTDFRGYRNGSELGNNLSARAGTLNSVEIYIGTQNNNGTPISPGTSRQCAGAGMFNGLTAAQVTAQYNARQTMNTALGRQV